MGAGFLDSTKKALTKRPSTSKRVSNHPLRNDNSCGDLEGRDHGSPKKKDARTVWEGIPPRGGVVLLEKDVNRARNFQPIREPIHVFPRRETTPPESIQRPNYRARQTSMHEFRVLTKEKKESQDQLSTTQNILHTGLNTPEARTNEIKRLQEEIQRLESTVISMVSAGKEAGNKICDLERKIRLQDEDIRNLQQRLRISEEQRAQMTNLLNDRTAELKGAQTFLTTADRYSGSDIIEMAESLNAEIFQASALMAELLVDAPVMKDSVQRRQFTQKYKIYLDHGRKVMGSRLFDHLVTKSSEIRVDPLPLQLAFQALFAWWCVYEVDRFCEGPTGKSLKQIYRRIHESEIQAVAGRWRVMTSVQTMNPDSPSQADFVCNVILGLMWVCGWFESQDISQRVVLSVQQAVLRVERMWKILKAAIMQDITAAEITMLHIGARYDYDVTTMDDMYMDTDSKNPDNCRQRVLCTVGVGLQRDVSKRSENGTMKIHREVMLKPKVVLASVLPNGEPSGSLDVQEAMLLSAAVGKKLASKR